MFDNINKNDIFFISVFSVFMFFFTTKVVKIEISHFVAIVLIVVVFTMRIQTKKQISEITNAVIEKKLSELSPGGNPPDFFYIDADLIISFDSIKENFYRYNNDAYLQALNCAGIVLEIKNDFDKRLCDNNGEKSETKFLSELSIRDNLLSSEDITFDKTKPCEGILKNSYENYQVAEEHAKKCINYLHSLIYSIPSEEAIHNLFHDSLNKVHVLLKRNLDSIRNIYYSKIKITHNTKYIDDYDLPKPFSKMSGGESAFNYF